MRWASVAVAAALLACTASGALGATTRAPLQLGFVRSWSIWLASPAGNHAHVVVRRKRPYRYLEPAWSRDGSLAVTQYEDTETHGYSSVAIIRPKRQRLHINTSTFDGRAAWSPNGKLVVYVEYKWSNGGTLNIANLVTRLVIPISEGGGSSEDLDDEPAWSPDGRTIAFTRPQVGAVDPRNLYVIGANGKGVRQVTTSTALNPSWSPDSGSIVFDNEHQIHVIRADGSAERPLTAGPNDSEPAWSPDGRQIAFQRGSSVWVMNADGSGAHRVVRNATQPAWK
jgi:Tol biopolymer transport system component